MLTGVRIALNAGTVRIAAPVDPVYETAEGRSTLEERYVAQAGGTENAVFFESFYGRSVGCNPRAIDRELAARAPEVRRYWSVVDLSVEVPEGAIAVVEGSPQWWHAPRSRTAAGGQRLAASTVRPQAGAEGAPDLARHTAQAASPCIAPASTRGGWPRS